jgi:hypothetical protein
MVPGDSGLFVFGNDPDGPRPAGFLRAIRLLRVLPIAESCVTEDGELTATSLELYDDGAIFNYFLVGNEDVRRKQAEAGAEMQRLARAGDREATRRYVQEHLPVFNGRNLYLRMEDDLGTAYEGLRRSGGSDNDRGETSYGLTPAVPSEATRLRLLVFEGDYQRETNEAKKREPERLLHTFEVSL